MNSEAFPTDRDYPFLHGGGEMGVRIRSHDWTQTPLGAPDRWSPSLRSALSICLNSRFPIAIYWGSDFILLYNDAWRPIVGDKHAWALGYPAREVWSEIWEDIGAELAGVLATGEGTFHQDDLLSMRRYGYTEECFFEYTFNPIQGDSGVEGVFNVVTETTYRVLNDRRSRLLREVAAQTSSSQSVAAACQQMMAAFAAAPLDLPLALLYTIDLDGNCARLFNRDLAIPQQGCLDNDRAICPTEIDLQTDDADDWSIAVAARTGRVQVLDNLPQRFGVLPGSPWAEPPQEAMVLPIVAPGQNGISGVLVAVASPRRRLDANYCDFFSQLAAQIGIAIANARSYEAERHRAEALAELDRAKTTFFSNVSHEFRTPLTLMLAPAEDAINDELHPLPPPQQERIASIQRNGQRLLKLVNTMLDFSRIEAGRVQACYEPTDLAAVTAELASVFRSTIERAGLELRLDCPTLSESVYIDREMWEKIVLNLLSNAFKFTFTGEIAVRLHQHERFPTGDATRSAVLEVSDTGIGIPAAEIPHLFERFHRVKGARGRSFEGSGIGLSLVWELVKLHQGTIEVASVEGEGTQMTVTIPLGTAHLPADRVASPVGNRLGSTSTIASSAIGADAYVTEALSWLPQTALLERAIGDGAHSSPSWVEPNIASARIILADDNADMRDYVKRLLARHYQVTAVADGQAVLAAVRERLPDLIITDVMMPGLDGFGLLQALRAQPQTREIPIVMLSAQAGEEARVEGLNAGADDYLVKPFSARELLARVEACLKLARLRQESRQQERQLRAAAETARLVVEQVLSSIKDGFYVLDRDWRFSYVSDLYCQMVSLERSELIGRNIWELFPAAVDTEAYTRFHAAIADQTAMQFDYLYQPWQVWHELRLYPSTEGVTVFLTDITERKQLELLQVEQNRLLEAIATGTPLTECLSAVCEAIGRLNPHVRACFRLMDERREFFAISIAPELPPSFARQLQSISLADPRFGTCGEAVSSRRAVTCADIANDAHRSLTWQQLCLVHGIAACHSQPAVSTDDRPFGSLLLCFDTARVPTAWEHQLANFGTKIARIAAERDRTIQALTQSEKQLRLACKGADLGMWFWNVETDLLNCTERAKEMFGLPLDTQMSMEVFFAAIHPDDRQFVRNVTAELRAGKEHPEIEYRTQSADGSVRWILAKGSCDYNQAGALIGTQGILLDITERKRAELARQFLDRLDLQIRQLTTAEAMLDLVLSQIGQFLDVDRAHVGAVSPVEHRIVIDRDWRKEATVASLAGVDRVAEDLLPEFTNLLERGESAAISDVTAHPLTAARADSLLAMGIRALITVPLVYEGVWMANITVSCRKPRQWRADEVALLQDFVARLWATIERARTLEKLQQSEAEFRQLANAMPQIVWTADGEGRLQFVNDRWIEYTGMDLAQTLDRDSGDRIIPRADRQRLQATFDRAKLTQSFYNCEFRMRRTDGGYYYFLARANPIYDRHGNLIKWYGTSTDITELKQLELDRAALLQQERAARQSAEAAEAKLQDILSSIREDFVAIDRQWRIVYLNQAAAMTLRQPQLQLIGRNIWEIFPDLVGTEVEARFTQVMHERKPVQFEYYYAPWQRWYENRAYPTAEGIVNLTTDITERKRLDAELRQKNAILEVVNQSAPALIFVKNRQGQIIYANPATLAVLGKTAEEVVGACDIDLYADPADAERVMANDRRIMETGQMEVVEETPDGIRTFLGMKAPYHNEAGEVIGLIGIGNDITERVQLERERERILQQERAAREEADRANRIKDEFLAVLSHELRSPLHPILGWIALLRSGKLDPAKSQQALATIDRNARLQSQLIEDLLDVSRILQGKLSLNVGVVDLAAVCRAALETVNLAAIAKSIDLQFTIAESDNLPYLVTGDAMRLQQVVGNLLSNAVKFTPNRGRISLKLELVEDRVQIAISDNGKGIAPEFLPQAFDYFRQEDGAITRKFGGLGLGLAIVRQIVERHGGTVRADSEGEGLGATFTVRLPLLSPPPVLESETNAPRGSLDLNGARILIIDDDADSLEFIAFAIEQSGASVTTAKTAAAGIDLLMHSHFDLLLSDIGMPELDGYRLMQQVRSLPPTQNGRIPAIALTAYAGDFDRQQALAAGFQQHLAKPIDPDVLVRAISDCIG